MRICYIGPATNYHIKKFCKWFCDNGHEVHVISFNDENLEGVFVHSLELSVNPQDYELLHHSQPSDIKKIEYLFKIKRIKSIVERLDPDIVHVHYASSYGLCAALALGQDYFLSMWGADVYEFPQKSILHAALFRFSLKKARFLLSTSNVMALEGKKYTKKDFCITPFGVDTELFSPNLRNRNDNLFVVGTVKRLSPKYGIEYLLYAIKMLKERIPSINIRVRIAGDGPQKNLLLQLSSRLGLESVVDWLGTITQKSAAYEWANMDVAVIPSVLESESFGVAAVEAESSGTPVIISDIPGLIEATSPGRSSLVVKRKSATELADALEHLYYDRELRQKLGIYGRKLVKSKYDINLCFNKIYNLYCEYISDNTYGTYCK